MAVLQPYLGMYFTGESFSLLFQGQAVTTSVVAGKLHWSGFAFAVAVPVEESLNVAMSPVSWCVACCAGCLSGSAPCGFASAAACKNNSLLEEIYLQEKMQGNPKRCKIQLSIVVLKISMNNLFIWNDINLFIYRSHAHVPEVSVHPSSLARVSMSLQQHRQSFARWYYGRSCILLQYLKWNI